MRHDDGGYGDVDATVVCPTLLAVMMVLMTTVAMVVVVAIVRET